jgi:hypothetical protein
MVVESSRTDVGYRLRVRLPEDPNVKRRDLMITFGEDGMPTRVEREDFSPARNAPWQVRPDSPPGLPLPTGMPGTEVVLASFEYSPTSSPDRFEIERVQQIGSIIQYNSEKAAAAKRDADAGLHPQDPAPRPLEAPDSEAGWRHGRNALLMAGGLAVAVGIGVIAWKRRR